MINQVEIRVEQVSRSKTGAVDCLFAKRLNVDNSVAFPYDSLYTSLRFLFPGDNVFITFRIG